MFAKQRSAALRAVEADETLAEAHVSLAIGLAWGCEFKEAEKEFKEAMELNVNYSTVHHWYAQVLAITGRCDEAILEAEKARELDPLSPTTIFTAGYLRSYAGQTEKTIAELENYREIDQNYLPINLWLGLAYVERSKFKEGIELIRSTRAHLPIGKPALAYAYARAGTKREALEATADLETTVKDQYDMLGIAGIYLTLGMGEESLRWFEKACANDGLEPDFLYRYYPWFTALSSDERFRASQMEASSSRRTGRNSSSLDEFLGSGLPTQSALAVVGGTRSRKGSTWLSDRRARLVEGRLLPVRDRSVCTRSTQGHGRFRYQDQPEEQ